MLKTRTTVAAILLAAPTAMAWPALEPGHEEWHDILLDAQKAGHMHVQVRSTADGGTETTIESLVRVNRLGDLVTIESTSQFTEDAEGHAVAVRHEQEIAANATVTRAKVVGSNLEIETGGLESAERSTLSIPAGGLTFPWSADRLLSEALERGEESLVYHTYMPELGAVEEIRVTLEGTPDISVKGHRYRTCRTRIKVGDLSAGLTTEWRDLDTGRLVQSRMDIMGIRQETELTDKATALTPPLGYTLDLLKTTLLQTARALPHPRAVDELTLALSALPEQDFPADRLHHPPLQTIEATENGHWTLRVKRAPEPVPSKDHFAEDFADALAPSLLVQSDAPSIASTARNVADNADNPLESARRLNQWVYGAIGKKGFGVGFASALETYRRREGDCTEHALLLAALCRSIGIPARVATGLVYFRGVFGYHMWTEVYVGTWFGLDPAFGLDSVDATHIKVADSVATSSLSAFVPLLDVMGRFELEIMTYTVGERRFSSQRPEVRIKGDRVESPEYQLRFDLPRGWKVDTDDVLPREIVTVAYQKDGTAQLLVRAEVISYEFTLGKAVAEIARHVGGFDRRRRMSVDGRAAMRLDFSDPFDGLPRSSLLFLDGDTYYAFTVENLAGEADEILANLAGSIRLGPS